MKVLYVEDYAPVAALVEEALRRRAPDIELEIVATVAEAIAQLERYAQALAESAPAGAAPHYDVVLTDLKLPDGQGLDVLAHVRRRRLPLAVVILTAEAGAIDATPAGADGYVPKRDDYLAQLPYALRTAFAKSRAAPDPTPLFPSSEGDHPVKSDS